MKSLLTTIKSFISTITILLNFPCKDNIAKQNQTTSTYQPGNSTEGISPKKKDLPFKQEQQRRWSQSRLKTETPTNKSKEENQRARSQSKPKTEISQKKYRFESLEDMELEDKTLKLSNKRKTDSKKKKYHTTKKKKIKHNPKTNMSNKDLQNSTIEMKEGNSSLNQLMDNRIPNFLEEPGTEPSQNSGMKPS